MKEQNLREGSIFLGLSRLALPIMLTSFIQMAYNLVDMIWIGRIGSGAMAAVGAAGIYLWFPTASPRWPGWAARSRWRTPLARGKRKRPKAMPPPRFSWAF